MRRRIKVKGKAFTRFIDRCKPDDETQDLIWDQLNLLKRAPNLGYRISFVFGSARIYQFRIGEYSANYTFDDELVRVLYIGILGICP
jgi:hypothetical protein